VRRILIFVDISHFFAWISGRNQQVACFPDKNSEKYAAFSRKSKFARILLRVFLGHDT